MTLSVVDFSYKQNQTICDLLCLLSFSNIFSIHHVVARINTSFLFNGWIIFHYMGMPQFVSSYFSWWPLDCSYFLAIMSSAAVNTHVQIFAWTYVSFLLLGVELLGHMVTQCLSFWGPAKLFFQSTPFYVIPSSVWEFPFPDILTNTWYCQSFLTHPSGVWCGIPFFPYVLPLWQMMLSIFSCV